MSTATIAAPAAPKATPTSKAFTLGMGESHTFVPQKIATPLVLRVNAAEVSSEFMTINGKTMSGPWLRQTVGPPHDPLAHQSARLRQKDRVPVMPRSEYRWEYTVPGVVRFVLSEVEEGGKPAVRFEIDASY